MEIMSLCLRNTWYFSNENVTGTILLYNAKRKKKSFVRPRPRPRTTLVLAIYFKNTLITFTILANELSTPAEPAVAKTEVQQP